LGSKIKRQPLGKKLKTHIMMNGLHNGWGMGYGWIIGLIVLVVVIWVIVKTLNQSNKSK
jgi:uncharacterized membrane protein